MKRIFVTRTFLRWSRQTGVTNAVLRNAVSEMDRGLIDADLGGQVLKKRAGLPGRGKRGGARVIVATERKHRGFFLYGFGKNERTNIDASGLRFFQEVAKDLLEFDDRQLEKALLAGELEEIGDDDKET